MKIFPKLDFNVLLFFYLEEQCEFVQVYQLYHTNNLSILHPYTDYKQLSSLCVNVKYSIKRLKVFHKLLHQVR